MKKRHSWGDRFWIFLLLALILVGGGFFFFNAGRLLVAEDSFSRADVGLVLSGKLLARSLWAGELYAQKKIDRILIIPEPSNSLHDKLEELGIQLPNSQEWTVKILTAFKVPREAIDFLPESVDGTIHEAILVRHFMGEHFPSRMVIITSKFASRRARFIFRKVFKNTPINILSSPTPYDSFQSDRWWTHPKNALLVVEEYEKFLVNAMVLFLKS